MSTAQEKPLSEKKMFILEDEPLIAIDLEQTLYDAGAHGVDLCFSTSDFLIDRLVGVDAAIIDLNIMGKSSIPIIQQVREMNIPVVVISGNPNDISGMVSDDIPYFVKPFNGKHLVASLVTLCLDPSMAKTV